MARIVAKNAKVFGGARNLSGRANSATLSVSGEIPDVSAFGEDFRSRLPDGLRDAELSVAGFTDLSACQTDESFAALKTASAWWGFYPGNSTASNVGREMNGIVSDYSVEAAVEGAVTFSVTVGGIVAGDTAGGSAGLFDVNSLADQTVSAIGASNLGSVDFTAACSHTVYNFFRVMTIAGSTPEIAACIQESTDDSTFTTLHVFTAASTADQVFAASAASSARYRRARVAIAASANGVVSPCATFQISSGSIKV